MQKIPLNRGRTWYAAVIDFFMKSAILQSLCHFTKTMYRKVSQSIFGGIFTGYLKMTDWLSRSRIVHSLKPKIKADPKKTISFKIAKLYDESIFSHILDKIKWSFLTCQLNVYAIFGLTFGFSSALVLILKNFAFKIVKIDFYQLMIIINPLTASLSFISIAILMVFSKKPLIRVINESRLISFILFDILRIRRMPAYEYEHRTGLGFAGSAMLGILLGGISYWFAPSKIAAAIGIAIMCIMILHSPEAGVTSIIFLLPFLPTMALVGMACITELSFIIKCIRRKRIFKFGALDIAIAVFALFLFSGGVISIDIDSSMPKMLVYLCFILMYFIVKNLVRSQNMLRSCLLCMATSSTAVSIIGILQYLMGNVSTTWQDMDMFGSIPGRAVSTFDNPNVLGEYLILTLPLIFAMLLSSKQANQKFLLFSAFMLGSCCLLFTWSRGAWLGFCFAVIIFILFKSHEFLAGVILISPAILLAASFFINGNVLDRILSIGSTSDSSTLYRMNIWLGSFDMIGDTWAYGIGIGTDVFAKVFPHYALAGTEVTPHTHSLYLQIISEMGIFALLSFVIAMFGYFSATCMHICNTTRRNSRTSAIGALCGISAFLIQGFTDYVWYNYRVYLFFWIMLGLSMAIVQISAEEDRRLFTHS